MTDDFALEALSDDRVHELCEIAAVTRVRNADEVRDEGRVYSLPALVGRDAGQLEEVVDLGLSERVLGSIGSGLTCEPLARADEPLVHGGNLDFSRE